MSQLTLRVDAHPMTHQPLPPPQGPLHLAVGLCLILAGGMLLLGCTPTAQEIEPTRMAPVSVSAPAALFLQLAGSQSAVSVDDLAVLAAAYDRLGQDEAALARRYIAAQQAQEVTRWRQLAEAWTARGNWQAARRAWVAVLQLAPDDAQANYQLGIILAPYDARLAYRYLEAVSDASALAQAAHVQAAHVQGAEQLREAIAGSELESAPGQSFQLGVTLAALGHWPQAEQAFAITLLLDPQYGEAWAYYGLARGQLGRGGATAFDQAYAFATDTALVYYLHGLWWRSEGDYLRSRQALAQAQQLDPANPAFAAELGTAYRLEGDFVLAETWLERAALLAPAQGEFLRLLAFFYAEEVFNLDGSGLTVLQEAVATYPEDADLQAVWAWALFALRRIPEAEAALATSLALAPNNPRALYYQALIYEYLGQTDLAVASFHYLLEQTDAQAFAELARRALERLEQRAS